MADSNRIRSDWLCVDRLPAFGEPPTVEDYNMALGGELSKKQYMAFDCQKTIHEAETLVTRPSVKTCEVAV
jgi:hypothetical protein